MQNTNLAFKIGNTLGFGARFEGKLYGAVGPYVNLEVLENEISATLNVSTSAPSVVIDNVLRCQPLQSAGMKFALFDHTFIDKSIDLSHDSPAFSVSISPCPVTIPLTGQVAATVN